MIIIFVKYVDCVNSKKKMYTDLNTIGPYSYLAVGKTSHILYGSY
jgi:hypothetical protein